MRAAGHALWLRLILPFTAGYFLSYLYRTVNAVAGQVLGDTFGLADGALGLLTSAYFLAFGAAQLPLGMLLDRYGARRVEAALLLVAAGGSLLFALADGLPQLVVARALIGLGVSACLMGAFKAFAQAFPPERQASLTGWIMASGSLGAFVAASPVEAALAAWGWRPLFGVLAGTTVLVATWLFVSVPEPRPAAGPADGLSRQWQGVRSVLHSRRYWRFAPLGLTLIGGFMAVQGLWAMAWLMEVEGADRATAARHLSAMNLAMLVNFVLIGGLATRLAHRGVQPLHMMIGGLALSLAALLLVVLQAAGDTLWLWALYGVGSCFGTLAYTQMARGYDASLAGRAITALNLAVFLGAFAIQWGLGVLLDVLAAQGVARAAALQTGFSVLWTLQAGALLWLVAGPRGDLAHRS
jgi:MFS family permease